MARKIILITAACSVLIAYGLLQGRLVAGSGGRLVKKFAHSNVDVAVKPPPGSKFIRSYESAINGAGARFGHYVSAASAQDIVERFIAERPCARGDATAPSIVHGVGCVAAGYADGSHVVGVVAFDAPSGCNFFLTRAPITAAPKGRPGIDVPGADAPGVPRPLNSLRMLSVQNLGGIPSGLAFYQGWGSIAENADYFTEEMARRGWKEHRLAQRLMNEQLPGETLSFAKGTKRCFIYFEKDRRTGKLTTAVLYRVRNWLPPANAF